MAKPVRINPEKLLEAAEELLDSNSGGRPRSIRLRRAVSSAYYGLFHHICLEGAATLLPKGTQQQQLWIARAFGHREIKDCCSWVSGRKGNITQQVRPIVAELKTGPLLSVSDAFCDLQEARHRADYDHLAPFTKAAVGGYIEDARRAMSEMALTDTNHRHAYFALLALKCRLA